VRWGLHTSPTAPCFYSIFIKSRGYLRTCVSSHRLLIDFSLLPSRPNTIYFFSPPFPPRGQGGFIFPRGGALSLQCQWIASLGRGRHSGHYPHKIQAFLITKLPWRVGGSSFASLASSRFNNSILFALKPIAKIFLIQSTSRNVIISLYLWLVQGKDSFEGNENAT
jgi:hypothetical protein